jgi:AraC-like DNA-binding protein
VAVYLGSKQLESIAFSNQAFHTTDLSACCDHIFSDPGTQRFDIDLRNGFSSFNHQISNVGGLNIHSIRLDCQQAFNVRKVEKAACHSFHFVVAGVCHVSSGRQSFTAHPGHIFILRPEQAATEHWMDGCQQFIVRIAKHEIDNAICKILGRKPAVDVIFKLLSNDTGISGWIRNLSQLPQNATPSGASFFENQHVAYHLEQSLIMMLLTEVEHSCTTEMSQHNHSPAPYYVKRVEDMFRANFENEISMDDIVGASGVSVRTVFYGFQRWRGTSPMNYLRDMRLDAARQNLAKPEARPKSVSEAALAVGFANFSQFSKLYKMRFGQKPSTTLAEARL